MKIGNQTKDNFTIWIYGNKIFLWAFILQGIVYILVLTRAIKSRFPHVLPINVHSTTRLIINSLHALLDIAGTLHIHKA